MANQLSTRTFYTVPTPLLASQHLLFPSTYDSKDLSFDLHKEDESTSLNILGQYSHDMNYEYMQSTISMLTNSFWYSPPTLPHSQSIMYVHTISNFSASPAAAYSLVKATFSAYVILMVLRLKMMMTIQSNYFFKKLKSSIPNSSYM